MGRKKEVLELNLDLYTKTGKLRKRKQKQTRNYFPQETQDAIIKYNASTDEHEKNEIFENYIDASIHKLAECVINSFGFDYAKMDSTIEDLKHAVVVFLLERIWRYDPEKGKAYSYFQTIAKRYLITFNKEVKDKLEKQGGMEEVDIDPKVFSVVSQENLQQDLCEFIDSYVCFVEQNLNNIFITPQEVKIAEHLLILFRDRETLKIFNKQVFYHYIRENTYATTNYITAVVKKMKIVYKQQLNVWYLKGCLETT